MTQRIPENFSAVEWRLVTVMATRCRRETPTMTMTMMMTRTSRSSESPRKMNKREGSCNSSPALISVRLDDWLR
jgi:hypothetical protein